MQAKNPSPSRKKLARKTRHQFTPQVCLLEDRCNPATFFVDPAFTGLAPGTQATYNNYPGQTPGPTVTIGVDGFATINQALGAAKANAEPDVINLAGTTHKLDNSAGTVVVSGDQVSLIGSGKGATIVKPTNNTVAAGGVSAGFVSVLQAANQGTVLNISNLTYDGSGTKIGRAVSHVAGATGTIDNTTFQNIVFGTTDGYALTAQNGSSITVTNSLFQNFGRAGITVSSSNAFIQGNTIIGQTIQNKINYGIQVANVAKVGDSVVTINANTIQNVQGGAADNKGIFLLSAGVFLFTNTSVSPTANIYGNQFNSNQIGVLVDSNAASGVNSSGVQVYANNFVGTANEAISAQTSSAGPVPAPSNFFSPGGAPLLNKANGVTVFVNVGNSSRNEPVPFPVTAATPDDFEAQTGIPQALDEDPRTFAAGAGGGQPRATIYDSTGQAVGTVNTGLPASFTGGVRVYQADVNGDGFVDTIVGTGPGTVATVIIISGKDNSTVLNTLTPFESTFTGGVFVSAADFNGDGKADVIVTPDVSGGPRVVIYNGGTSEVLLSYFGIDDPGFRGGARTGVGDVNGDGVPDLLVAAGFSGGPRITIWSGKALLAGNTNSANVAQGGGVLANFFAFEDRLRNGAYVSAADLNGDGFADPIFGAGPGGSARVRVADAQKLLATQNIDATGVQIGNFFVSGTNPDEFRGGVRVLGRDLTGSGVADIVTGSGEKSPSNVQIFAGSEVLVALAEGRNPNATANINPFNAVLPDGVYVG